uniref:Uncharacterized protein n=1 Tax=Anguilla anguilla TaxID=7936 RepID=A0A0E9VBU6_ANGAN
MAVTTRRAVLNCQNLSIDQILVLVP